MGYRKKKNLLPIIKRNVFINNQIVDNIDFRKKIYSDCYLVYRALDFNRIGFLLHLENHFVWFDKGMFHINSNLPIVGKH